MERRRIYRGKVYLATRADNWLSKSAAEARVRKYKREGFDARKFKGVSGGWTVWHRKP